MNIFATILEAISRIVFALLIAFLFWVVLGQASECPVCHSPLDNDRGSTRVAP